MWPLLDRARTVVLGHKIISAVVFAIILLSGIYLWGNSSEKLSGAERIARATTLQDDDWVRGDRNNARAILFEYSDFECPACAAHHDTLTQLKADMGDDLAVVYRHFPLSAIHPHAVSAARAAEAAGLQDKFFEMHDQLFINQQEWSHSEDPRHYFLTYARTIGLNEAQFQTDLDAADVAERVEKAERLARELHLKGTPTFFLNGEELLPQRTFAEFKTAILSRVYKGQ